jgi:mono/diheme cytochrome c family protein
MRRSFAAAIAGLLLACDQPEPPAGGAALFTTHCAPCHGASGLGDGAYAAEIGVQPADLTRIAERAGGKFDEGAVFAVIDGRRAVAAHGPREMPVWGDVFATELEASDTPRPHSTALERSRLLVDYLRTLQVK